MPFPEDKIAHITKLRKRPELLERFAAILEISDGEDGEIKRADEVKALLIEEAHKPGNARMGQWAKEELPSAPDSLSQAISTFVRLA